MTFEDFKQACLQYIDEYDIGGWRVLFNEKKEPNTDGTLALCHTNLPNKQATIDFYPGANTRAALHEVAHIMTAEIYHTLLTQVSEYEANRLIHTIINHIVNKELGVL
jgi:hypothetical protein